MICHQPSCFAEPSRLQIPKECLADLGAGIKQRVGDSKGKICVFHGRGVKGKEAGCSMCSVIGAGDEIWRRGRRGKDLQLGSLFPWLECNP